MYGNIELLRPSKTKFMQKIEVQIFGLATIAHRNESANTNIKMHT